MLTAIWERISCFFWCPQLDGTQICPKCGKRRYRDYGGGDE